MKILFFLFLSLVAQAQNPIVQIDCHYQYLPDASQIEDGIYQFAQYSCTEPERRSQVEVMKYPSKSFKKFKQLGEKRTSIIYSADGAVEQSFSENETIFTSATYYIPPCIQYKRRWRLQIAAIADPTLSANEVFYNKIAQVIALQIPTKEIVGWNFCKTYGEEFGAYQHGGTNKTTRLFLQFNGDELEVNRVDNPRELLGESCLNHAQGGLFEHLIGSSLEQPGALIIPPLKFIDRFFTVSDYKFQFENCANLVASPHLKLKP